MKLLSSRQKRPDQPDQPAQARKWNWLGGRRVLTHTPSVMPRDMPEGHRLEVQHHLFKLAAGGLYRAPLRRVKSVLDVACGTGVWAREMALAFPQARVIGFDIDASHPKRALDMPGPGDQFPQNLRFLVADALQPFPFEEAAFDFVHARLISPFVPIARFPQVVQEMMRVLRPAGYLELVELEKPPQTCSPAFNQLAQMGLRFMEQRGLHVGVGDALIGYLQRAGAQHIQQRKFVLGQGQTSGDTERQQRLLAADMLAAQANFKPIAARLGVPESEYETLHQQAKAEVAQMGIMLPIVFCYGMKL